jgi:hypothetical protein
MGGEFGDSDMGYIGLEHWEVGSAMTTWGAARSTERAQLERETQRERGETHGSHRCPSCRSSCQ